MARRLRFRRLTVGTANLFVRNNRQGAGLLRLARWWKTRNRVFPDALAGQEARQILDRVFLGLVYKIYGDQYGVIAVKRWFRVEFATRHDGAPAIGDNGPNRKPRKDWHVGFIKRGQRCVVINTHNHVVPEQDMVGKPRSEWPRQGRVSADHSAKVVADAVAYASTGWLPVVCADSNSDVNSRWVGSLANQLRKAGFGVFGHKVDLIGVPLTLAKFEKTEVVDRRVVGSDKHASLIASITPVHG